ncbi:acetyltransferase [Salinarchaeum sp. Harcht-Bsk1]|uniref:GNAT family N-acetyltransferase n=1 Tax=Salinarchaeum sp. Harcht-Bsk1 TaxID=1333523 RepID=UPI000342427E|nr:N-acetyltransferase [Salinarchaeum sp. Harcht-Bsk1]AGN00960.1 acetyltransferase [Salinarchaeum sp. Harcht-Bsk1]
MSVTVETRSVGPGSDEYLEAAWELKERIRRSEGVLKQRRGFFADAYRRSRVHVLLADEEVVGFAAVRRDGYVLFLAIASEYRGQGFGERLIARVAEEHDSITCHARASNEGALGFYENLGFEIRRRIDNYYEDGGDAYYLKLGEDTGLTSKITDALR